ncbi:hypothetical protein CK203_084298 [Vitis vinifera]|uniref:Retrotransposon gag domain-containing protein n=1 Tax=Vitis vinifera TaxID=29760 RepID=A0A438BMR4_VITVI|nr:hypothetical protein CK203_084298 [Vitis vinifera]
MQENESLRKFMKRFGQVVLQVESYSMDVVLQIFKRSICLGTQFFESLAKTPPMTMDDLFRRANKYSMLKDDVRAAPNRSWLPDNQPGTTRQEIPDLRIKNHEQQSQSEPPPFTPFTVSYEKLLPMIRELFEFR